MLLKENAAHLHDEVVDNLHKFKSVQMTQAVTTSICSDIFSAFLLFTFRVSPG